MYTGTHSSTVPCFIKSISRKRVWCVCVYVYLLLIIILFTFQIPRKCFHIFYLCFVWLWCVSMCWGLSLFVIFSVLSLVCPKVFLFVSKSKRNVMGRKLTKDQFIFWFKNNWPDKRKMDLTSYWQWWVSDDFKLIEKKKGMESWK